MDFIFFYVLAGQKGSVYNDHVLEDAFFHKNFTILDKKYYLANAGYYNTNYLLYLYCRVCYYLKNIALAEKKPTIQEELFNLCYFNLQNKVERIFGVIKR